MLWERDCSSRISTTDLPQVDAFRSLNVLKVHFRIDIRSLHGLPTRSGEAPKAQISAPSALTFLFGFVGLPPCSNGAYTPQTTRRVRFTQRWLLEIKVCKSHCTLLDFLRPRSPTLLSTHPRLRAATPSATVIHLTKEIHLRRTGS